MRSRSSVFVALAALVLTVAATSHGQVTMSSTTPPVMGFIDITATGINVPNATDDSSHPFFLATGNALFPSGNLLMGNNGVVIAGLAAGFIDFSNQPITPGAVPSNLPAGGTTYLCPWWDDLLPNAANSPSSTTLYAQASAGVVIFMWKNETHFGIADDTKTIWFEVQIFTDPQTSCTPLIQYLYQDSYFGAGEVENNGGRATIGGVFPQGNVQFSFNAPSIQSGSCLSFFFLDATLTASSPFGPGSIQVDYTPISCLPSTRFLAVTFNHGSFPNGWLFGLDIPFNELAQEIAFGPPFLGFGGPEVIGPFGGLPSGVTIHAVALGLDNTGLLIGASDLLEYTIP